MKNKLLIILVIFSLLPTLDLFHNGLPVTHDGQDHVARIANFYASFSEGNVVPRWAANLNWGYGHPILMFLYPLPSYFASLFHALGFTFVEATKLVFAAAYIGSILVMYLWLEAQWGSVPGFVGAILYGFAPYRFVDFTVRGAIGEHTAFLFPPLIFWSLLLLARHEKDKRIVVPLLSVSTAGLILSHNAISLMFSPLIFLYILYLGYHEVQTKNRIAFFLQSMWGVALGFLLSAFFWIPAFFEGKYTLRNIVTKGDFINRFVPWSWFIYSPWNYGGGNQFTKQLGFVQILAVVYSIFFLKKTKERLLIVGSLVIFVVTLFMMTNWSRWIWYHITILQKFQFPWRFLSVTTFLSAPLGAIVISRVSKKYIWFVEAFFVVLATVSTIPMWRAKEYSIKPESFYTGVYYGTTDTGESSPIWSVRFMEHAPTGPMQVVEGSANILVEKRKTTMHSYEVQAEKRTRLVENTLYFPGWSVRVDGQIVPVEFQDPNYRGLMTFWVESGNHKIAVHFGDTRLRTIANITSIAAVLLLGITIVALNRGNYAKTVRFR